MRSNMHQPYASMNAKHYSMTLAFLSRTRLILALFLCCIVLPQASHSFSAGSTTTIYETHLTLSSQETNNNLELLKIGQLGGTSTTDYAPGRRGLSHKKREGSTPRHSHGVKVDLRRIESPCGLEISEESGHNDRRLKCAIRRSSLRAQEVRRRTHRHRAQGGSKKGGSKSGGTAIAGTASGFEAPVAAARGEYLATVRLGTPEKNFSLIVDTGSDLTWVQCSPCGKCYPQADSLFLPNTSTSYNKLSCTSALCNGLPYPMCNNTSCVYWYSYGDGSLTTGDFSYDTMTLDGINGQKQQVPNFAFGCGHDNEGSFAGADGIVGLGNGPLSVPSQLKSIFNGKFSYCLVDWLSPPTQTSPLLFGEAAVPTLPDVKYLNLVTNPKNPTYYYVKLNGISVGNQLLSIPAGVFDIDTVGGAGTIFDSGTTVTQLAKVAYVQVLTAINATVAGYPRKTDSSGLDLCLSGVQGQLPKVPNLTFHFDGADMFLPVSNFFIFMETSQAYCLSMLSSPDVSIIGSLQQQNFQIFYDTINRKIGYVPKTCG